MLNIYQFYIIPSILVESRNLHILNQLTTHAKINNSTRIKLIL